MFLKQSTAVTVKVGPFVDSTDGNTEETALTISQADIRLSKNGGAFAQTNNATGATHDEKGWYGVPLDTTDTNTLGKLELHIHESGALPVWRTFMVLSANVYDSLFSTDKLQVDAVEWNGMAVTTPPAVNATQISGDSTAADNLEALLDGTGGVTLVAAAFTLTTPITANATQISGDATAADNAESFFDGTGYAGTNNVIPTVTTLTNGVTVTTNNDKTGYSLTQSFPSNFSSLAITAAGKVTVGTNDDKTGYSLSQSFPSNFSSLSIDGSGLVRLSATGVADITRTAMTESYSTDGSNPTLEQALFEIRQYQQERSTSGTTVTVKKKDGSTTAMTFTINDSASPTSITRAT